MNIRFLFAFALFFSFLSCDDGDIIVTSFDFSDQPLQLCGETGDVVFFKINNDARESISFQLNTADELFVQEGTVTYPIASTSNTVNYRIFNGDIDASYYCNSIPPTSPQTNVEYTSSSGTASITTSLILNDNDNLDEDIEATTDTDNDGLLNYFDFDDDGDNVPTAVELGADPANPMDTDMDGTPDYLDADDDGDGVLTINEDTDMDLNPANDISEPTVGPDYLNADVSTSTNITSYREHTYSLSSNAGVVLFDLVLSGEGEQITQETLDLGDLTNVVSGTVTVTPEF